MALASPLSIVPLASAASASPSPSFSPLTLQSGGSTFVNPVMQVWIAGFKAYSGGTVNDNYQAVGSGAGITNLLTGVFDWAGSDAIVSAAQLAPYAAKGPLLQIPETLGGVAIFYNVPGVTANLHLTGPIIADIYLGIITKWNDSAIQALNPSVTLPGNTIIPVHRSDGSGTTFALSHYFEQVSTDWNTSWTNGVISTAGCPCFGTTISWPSFEIAAKGSGGVAAYVTGNPNTIGYADSYYAFYNNLKAAAVQNSFGNFMIPSLADISNAANDFSAQTAANPTFIITNAPGANSYPISTYTFLLAFQNQPNQNKGADIAAFFWWIVSQGQAFGPPLYYPALPSNVVTIDEGLIQQMNYNGVPFISSTTTQVVCNKQVVTVGKTVSCTAAVNGSTPKGAVTWSSLTAGKFSKIACVLAKGACKVSFTPQQAGPKINLTASYVGDGVNQPSYGQVTLNVTKHASTLVIVCKPASMPVGGSVFCSAAVGGFHLLHQYVTGNVTFTQLNLGGTITFPSGTSCALTNGKCSISITGAKLGHVGLIGTFSGDSNNYGIAKTKVVIVHS